MKTWAAALIANKKNGTERVVLVFISAFDEAEAQAEATRLCYFYNPEGKGYSNQRAIVRDTLPMYEELRFVR